jgi:O-antigen ligase
MRLINLHISFSTFCAIFAIALAGLGTISIAKFGPVNIHPYQLFVVLGLLIVLLKAFGKFRLSITPIPFVILLFFIALCIGSITVAENPTNTIKQTVFFSFYGGLFLLSSVGSGSRFGQLWIYRSIILVSILLCIREILIFAGVIPTDTFVFFYRPRSFFQEGNEYGEYLVFTSGFIFAENLLSIRSLPRIVGVFAVFLLILILLPNMSRGSWLGCIMALFVVVFLGNKFGIKKISLKFWGRLLIVSLVILGLTTFVVSKVVPSNIVDSALPIIGEKVVSIFSGKDPTASIRWETNTKAFEYFMRHPFFGTGLGNVYSVINEDGADPLSTGDTKPVTTTSNFLTDILVETGVVGFCIFSILLGSILIFGYRNIRKSTDPQVRSVFIGSYAAFLGLCINGLTYASHMLPFMWIAGGILMASHESCSEQKKLGDSRG